MSPLLHISKFTPLTFLYLLFFFTLFPDPISSIHITDLLLTHTDLSDFTTLLTTTANLAGEMTGRSHLTLLAVPNSFIRLPYAAGDLAGILRRHILLEYITWSDLRRIPPAGKLVETLGSGTLNITVTPIFGEITVTSPDSNATVLSPIETLDSEISIFSINSLLIPHDLDHTASESDESPPAPTVDIAKQLNDGHNFNVFTSLLIASGVVSELESDEFGAGISVFAPTDEAFADLPSSVRLPELSADQKAMVLRFHVLHSYYPLGSLVSIVNPVQPTLATEQNGAGRFTLNISRVKGSVSLNTGIVQASITRTVFDQNPVSIFGISKVLLPSEIFGSDRIKFDKSSDGAVIGSGQSLNGAMSPENSPGSERSLAAEPVGVLKILSGLWCIAAAMRFGIV